MILRDLSCSYFVYGLPGTRISSFDEIIAWLDGYIRGADQIQRVYTLGISMSAFAAIRAAHLLDADVAYSFGINETALPGICDLRELLSVSNGKTKFQLYFNEHFAHDKNVSSRLSSLPGVSLCPQSGTHHFVFQTLWEQGMLTTLFPTREPLPSRSHPQLAPLTDAENLPVSEQGLYKYFEQELGVPTAELTAETALFSSGLVDSMSLLSLVTYLEETLSRQVHPEDVDLENLDSVAKILRLVSRYCAKS